MEIKVLMYTDVVDNTKGSIAAFDSGVFGESTAERERLAGEINGLLGEFITDEDEDAWEVGRCLAYTGFGHYGDYEFYFETVPLFGSDIPTPAE